MKNAQEFAEKLVNIDFIESGGGFGHYPFQMFVRTKDDSFEMVALAIGGVAECYRIIASKMKEEAKTVFVSLDFPAGGDMKTDFVAVIALEKGAVDIFAIPYDPQTGKREEIIKESQHLNEIKRQLMHYYLGMRADR